MMYEVISSYKWRYFVILKAPIKHSPCNVHEQVDCQIVLSGLLNQQTDLSKRAVPIKARALILLILKQMFSLLISNLVFVLAG